MGFFLFDGLEPIWSRLFLDSFAISILGYCISHKPNDTNTVLLLIPIALTWMTAGLTKRWTLTFPMIPLVLLQELRRLSFFHKSWAGVVLSVVSTILLILTIALCIAFPAIQPPPIPDAKYHVGIVDLHFPVNFNVWNTNEPAPSTEASRNGSSKTDAGHVVARILYPTDETGAMPYLNKELATEYLQKSIEMAAPPPINALHWFLDNWKLITLNSKPNAKVLSHNSIKFPLVVFSHGMGGSANVYSHQTRSLASQGYVVLAVTHADGSAPVVQTKDGTIIMHDQNPKEFSQNDEKQHFVFTRRTQTEFRAKELAAAAIALKQLNEKNIPELDHLGISFLDRLDTENLFVMGHSFGGVTALTVGFRRPDLVKGVVAHEPATDWEPDDVRRQMFPDEAIAGYEPAYKGGTGGFGEAEHLESRITYNDLPILFLFSHQWWELGGWGMCKLIRHMFQGGFLGERGDYALIAEAYHNEFSDMCFLTPLWMARALKVTGIRNPIDTSIEIANRTLTFLESLRNDGTPSQTTASVKDAISTTDEL